MARPARPELPARPVRRSGQVPGRADRRSRQDRTGRLLLRRAERRHGLAIVSQSRFRRKGAGALGPGTLLHRRGLLQRPQSGSPVSGRHVLRLLPCRPERDKPARGPGKPEMGKPGVEPGSAIFLGQSHFLLEHEAARHRQRARAQRGELPLPVVPHKPARQSGYVAGFDRLHEQSADDECGLQRSRPPRPEPGHR